MLENKIGLEFEGVVLGENDRLIKNVDSLNIFDSNNVGKETTKDRLELRTDPHNSVSDAFKEFLQLMDSYDLIKTKTFLPFNHDGNKKKVVFRDDSLAVVKKLFLGEDYSFEGLTRGFHIHFSLPDDEEKIIKNYNTAIALDPFGLAVMNSFSDNESYAWRANGYRKDVYSKEPFFGDIPNYMYSFAEHLGNLEEQFNNICEKYWDEGGEEYSKRSNPLSAINGPVRVRFASESEKKIGYDDTIEIRTPDSNPLLTLGFSYTEILHWLISKSSDYGMRFSNKPKISFDGSDIVLPNNWLLKYLSNKTLKNGLDDDVITDYCLSILNSADKLGYTNSEVFNKLTDNIFDKKGFNYSLKDYKNSGWFFNENEKICCFVRDTVRQEYDDLQKML